jgi:hypothetical protein
MNRLRIGRGCQVAGLVLIVLALALLGYLLTRPPGVWRAWKAKGGPKPKGPILGEALFVIVALLLIGLMLIGTAHF